MKPFNLLLILGIIFSFFPTCAEAWPGPATVVGSLSALFVGTFLGTHYLLRQSRTDSCGRDDPSSCIANDSLLNPANYIYKPLPPPPKPTPSDVCSLPVVSPFVCDAAWIGPADPEPVPSNSTWFESLLEFPQHIKVERSAVFEMCKEGIQWFVGSFLQLLSIIFEPALKCLRHEYGKMAIRWCHHAINLFWIYLALLSIIEVARRIGDAMPDRMKDFFSRNSPVLRDIILGYLGVAGIAVMLAISFTALTIGACVAFVWSWVWAGIMQGFEDLLEAFFRIRAKHKLQESDQEALLRECASHGPLIRQIKSGQESLKQEVDHVREEIVPVFYDCRTPGQPDNAIVAPSTADVVAVCNSGTSYVATALNRQQQDIVVVQRELRQVRNEVNSKKDGSVGPTSTSADSVSKKDLEASQQEVKAMVKQQMSVLNDAFNDGKRAENCLRGEVELLKSAQAAVPTPSEPGVSQMDFLLYKTEVSNRFATFSARVPEQHSNRRVYMSIDRLGRTQIDELQAQIEARPTRQEFNALVSKVALSNMDREDASSSMDKEDASAIITKPGRRKRRQFLHAQESKKDSENSAQQDSARVVDGPQKTSVEDVSPVSVPETSTLDQTSTSGLPASEPPPPADPPAPQPSSAMSITSGSQALARYFNDFPAGVDTCSIQAPERFNNGLRALNDSMDGQHSDVLDLQVPTVGDMEQLMIQPEFVTELLKMQVHVPATNMMSQLATFFVLLQRWTLQTKFNRPICLGFTTPQRCKIIYNKGDLQREELLCVWIHYDSVRERADSNGQNPENGLAKLQSNWLGLERRYPEDTQPAQSVLAAPPSTPSLSVGAVAVPPPPATPPPRPASQQPAAESSGTDPLPSHRPASPQLAPASTVTDLQSSPSQPSKGSDNQPLPADTSATPSIPQPTPAPSEPKVPDFFKKPFKFSLKMSKTEKAQPQTVKDTSAHAKDNDQEVNKSVVVPLPVPVNSKPSLQNEQTGEAQTEALQSTEDKPISNEPDDGFDHSMGGTAASGVTTADTGATGVASGNVAPSNQEVVVLSQQLAQQQTTSIPSTTSSGQDLSRVAAHQSTEQNANSSAVDQEQMEVDTDLGGHQVGFGNQSAQSDQQQPAVNQSQVETSHDDMDFEQNQVSGVQSHPPPPPQEPQQPLQEVDMQDSTPAVANTTSESRPLKIHQTFKIADTNAVVVPHQPATQQTVQLPTSSPSALEAKDRFLTDLGRAELDPEIPPYRHVEGFHSVFNAIVVSMAHQYPDELQPVLQDLYRPFMRYGGESRESHKRVALAFQDWAKQTLSRTLFLGVKYAPGISRDDIYAIFPPSLVANGTRHMESVLWITCSVSDYYSLQGCHPLCRGYDSTIEDWNWVSQVSEPNGLEPLPRVGDGLAAIIDSATRQFPPQWRKPGLTGLKAVLDHVEGKPQASFKQLGPLIVALVFSNWFDLYSNTQTPVYLGIKDVGLKEDQCRVFVPDLVPGLYSGKGNFEILWIYRHKEGHNYSGMGRQGVNTTTGWATFQRIQAQSSLAANVSSFRWSSIAPSQAAPTAPPPPSSEAAKLPAENVKSGPSQVQGSAAQSDFSGTSSSIKQAVNSGASAADQPQQQGAAQPGRQEAAAASQADTNEEELSPFEIASRRQEEEKNKIKLLNAQLTKAAEEQVKKYSAEARTRFIKDFSRSQKGRPEEMTVAGSSHIDTWLNAVVLSMSHQFPDQVQPTTTSLREFVNQQGGSTRESLGIALNKWADHHIQWPVFLGVRIYDASETCTYRIHPEGRFKDTDFVLWVNCDVRTASNQFTQSTYRALRCAYDPKFEDWQLGETDERRPREVFPDGYDLIHLGSRAEDVNNALHAVAASALWQWNDLPEDDNPGPLISEAILPIWKVAQTERMLRDDCIDAEDLGYVFAVWYSIWGKRRTKWYLGVWEEEERVSKIFAACDKYDDPIVDDNDPILWIRKEKGKNIYAGMRGREPQDWPVPKSSEDKDKSNDADDAMDEDGSDKKDPKDGQGGGANWRKSSAPQQLSDRSAPQKQAPSAVETATNYDFKNALTKPPTFNLGFAGATLPSAYPSATASSQLSTPVPQAYPLFSPNMHKFTNNQAASSTVAFTQPVMEEKAKDGVEQPSTAATTQSKPDRETENNEILDLAHRQTSPPSPPSVIDDKTAQDSMRKLLEKRKLKEGKETISEYRDMDSDQKSDEDSDSVVSGFDDDMSDADDDDDEGAALPGSSQQPAPQSDRHDTAPSDESLPVDSTRPEDTTSTETTLDNEQTPPASGENHTQSEPSNPAGAAFGHHMNYDDDTGLTDRMDSITLNNDDEMEEFMLDNDSDAEECVLDMKRKADEYDCDADDEDDGAERPQRNPSVYKRFRDVPDQSPDELTPADRQRLDDIRTSLQESAAKAARENAARAAREAAEKEELAKLEQLMDAEVYNKGGQTDHVQIKGWVASETKDIVDENGVVVATYSETPDNVPLPSTPDQEPADTREDGHVEGLKLDGDGGQGEEAPLPPWPAQGQTSQPIEQDEDDVCIVDSDDDSDFGSESHDAGADNSVSAGRSADAAEDENMSDRTSNSHTSNSPSSMASVQNHEVNASTDDSVGIGDGGPSGEESDSNADSDSTAQTQEQSQVQAHTQPQTQAQTQPVPQASQPAPQQPAPASQTPSTSTTKRPSTSTSRQLPLGSVSMRPAVPGRKILKPKGPKRPKYTRFEGFAALGSQGVKTEFVGPFVSSNVNWDGHEIGTADLNGNEREDVDVDLNGKVNADSKEKANSKTKTKGILKVNGDGKANADEKPLVQLQQLQKTKKKRVRFEEDGDEEGKGQGQLKRKKSLDEGEGDDGKDDAARNGMEGVE